MRKVFLGLMETILLLFFYPLARLYGRTRNIWIICERGTDARDNGYHMFKFLRNEHPEIKVYYIISNSSADKKNVDQIGKTIPYKSIKHYFFQYAAQVRMSTHIYGFATQPTFYRIANKYRKFPGLSISLKHGITKDNLPLLYAENTGLDLVIAGAKPEYDYMLANFHYKEKNLQYTGFARFDNLIDTSSGNQILIMPTWRNYLSEQNEEVFCNSEYYKKWQSLLNSPLLFSELEKNNIKLIFYPHYEMQRFIHLFHSDYPNAVIANKDEYDVQVLLRKSDLLVTDYSSVFFDFAYMNKPCIYYQFDEAMYRENQYHKGYFDYRSMGFGEVVENEEELIQVVGEYVAHSFVSKDYYQARHKSFFPLHDNKNCERIYKAILNLMN